MARKTFATLNYFNYEVEIADLQAMLGHKSEQQTMHYLRIEDDARAKRIQERRSKAG